MFIYIHTIYIQLLSVGKFNLPVIREHEKIRPDYTYISE